MKHTIHIKGGGSVTRDKPPVNGQPLHQYGGPVVLILSEKLVSETEKRWDVELVRIRSNTKP